MEDVSVSAGTRAVVTALLEAWNAHDVEHVVALYAADFEGADVAFPLPLRGVEDVRHITRRYLEAFPDLELWVEHLTAWERDVALAWWMRGTHLGPLLHIPPTNRKVEVCGITMLEVAEGKVYRSKTVWDVAGLLRAFGLLPQLDADS